MDTGITRYGDRLLQVPALRRDGEQLSIAFTVSLLHDDMRTPVGVAAIIRDDTETFKLRRAARPQPGGTPTVDQDEELGLLGGELGVGEHALLVQRGQLAQLLGRAGTVVAVWRT